MSKSPAKELVRIRTGREVPELLRELFVDRRFNHSEIGIALGVNRETVRQWLAEFGISRDDRTPIEAVVEPVL